jgi:hypothetical protein
MVLAALLTLSGIVKGVSVWNAPDSFFQEVFKSEGLAPPQDTGFDPIQFARASFMIICVAATMLGILLFILALFVRRGGKASAIGAIILVGLILLFLLLQSLGALIVLSTSADAVFILMVFAAIGALCVVTIRKLLAAYRAGTAADMSAMQAHFWMMQQQPQAAGYGYSHGPLAPPPGAAPISFLPPFAPLPPPPRDLPTHPSP